MKLVDATFKSKYEEGSTSVQAFNDYFYDQKEKSHGRPSKVEAKALLIMVVFKFCLGEWAGKKLTGISIADCNSKNWALKDVSFHRIYHVGEDIYAFGPGLMPMRIDFSEYRFAFNAAKNMRECSLSNVRGITSKLPKQISF